MSAFFSRHARNSARFWSAYPRLHINECLHAHVACVVRGVDMANSPLCGSWVECHACRFFVDGWY